MYLEHFQLHTSPFREEIDSEVFFPEADREYICEQLEADIKNNRVFIKLLGGEGSGKTLLCKVLAGRLPDDFEVLYVDNPTGSFDDLLRFVCLDLGMAPGGEQADLTAELHRQLQRRQKYGRRVVLIIDDAEKIFLATLERLLRLPCETGEISPLTLLLAGRPGLDANLQQLTVYCTGVDIEYGYALEPMSREETGRYLSYRLSTAGCNSLEHQEIFTGEAIEKIFASALGNPRMTNILAEEALQKSCSEKSFLVLLDHVDAGPDKHITGERAGGWAAIFSGKGKQFVVAGAVFLLFALVFFFFQHQDKTTIPASDKQAPVTASEGVTPPVAEPATVPLPPASGKEKRPAQKKTVNINHSEAKRVPSTAEGKKNPIFVRQNGVKKQVARSKVPAKREGNRLFQERLRASAEWLAGAYRGQYTIQLMMLSSQQAEENVKKLLVQKDYFAVIDKLHILRKKTNPPTLFVFYGTYPSMDAARQVRNNMPLFLRKHHPYALSIADALTKTED